MQEFQTESLLPEYTVEILRQPRIIDKIIFPFIFNGYLYCFSLHQEAPLWRIFIGGDLLNPYTVHEDNVYFYDIYNRIYSIDLSKGKTLWRIYLEHEIRGKPIIFNDYIIAATLNGIVHVIDRKRGEILFTYEGGGELNAGLNVYKSLIIIPFKNGKIVAYDLQSRNVQWVFNAGGLISIRPIVKDKYLYFGSWNSTFYALDISTGEPLWISYVGDTITREFIVYEHEIILFFAKGEMVCLNRDGGEIKWVKYYKNVEFNYNYFSGHDEVYLFIPDFIAIDPHSGNLLFDYRERSFRLYKEMLFDNMVEGKHQLTDEKRIELLANKYFNVSHYPYFPPSFIGKDAVYFITDNSYLYVYDLTLDFFILKFKMD